MIRTLLLLLFFSMTTGGFRQEQKEYKRVRDAYAAKEKKLEALFSARDLDLHASEIFIRVHKAEKELELWGRRKGASSFKLVTTYPVCQLSGELGPKRKKGDLQTPEGFYFIDRFNPTSSYHLSLGINYPNSCDRFSCNGSDPGGDIFIHGKCVTIGCLPLTDDLINELYVVAVEVKHAGQKNIPVSIFPCRMNSEYFQSLIKKESDPSLKDFWGNLKTGYDLFEKSHELPKTSEQEGRYKFS
jgi:murein L,D-transpeptidase YafK